MAERVIIVGAGQAGAQAAQTLRQQGHKGEILLIGAERFLPYQRPPLSKIYLQGEMAQERLYLKPAPFFDEQNITLRLNERVVQIDRGRQIIMTDRDAQLSYDKLLLATGAPPRRLSAPGSDLSGIHYLRSVNDSDALRPILSSQKPVLIVGAGYIGLEVAAVARKAGRDVTVLEMADRVLARVASEPVSHFYEKLHRDAGVDLRLHTSLHSFSGEKSLSEAILTSGERLVCGAALIGIGSVAETGLAAEAGLKTGNGIVVDKYARTDDRNIWSAGDCTWFPSQIYGCPMRLESVPNAIEQAKIAAMNMMGAEKIYDALPWFWSDQYDVKLQTAGISQGFDQYVLRGDPDEKKFSVWYLKASELLAVDAINDPVAFNIAKRVIGSGRQLNAGPLADNNFDLKQLLNA